MPKILTRSALSKGGRDGRIQSRQGKLDLQMAKPKELGGEDNEETNPEEIFAAGYSACFASSLEYMLTNEEVSYASIEVEAEVHLVTDSNDGGFKFDIDLHVTLEGPDENTSAKLIDQAYAFCPYSKAITNNVEVRIHRT